MFNLLPKDTVFFDLFERLARHAVASAEHLRTMARNFPNFGDELQHIRDEEHAADELAHAALERLDRTFITPFDREDIHELVGGLDDIIDAVDALAKRIPLYHLKSIEPKFLEQIDVLIRAAAAVSDAVHRLRKARKLSELKDKLIEIHHMESAGDDNHHAALSELYHNGHDPLHVMKWKEFYEMIEDAIDGCEDVGNTLERIVLKNG
jgi:predicted phosphate transport protein (TIGR00153 family)